MKGLSVELGDEGVLALICDSTNIMRDGVSVHGLNTAATVWCSAMVGALCGFGMWEAAGIAAWLVLMANLALRPIANWQNTRVRTGNEVESTYTVAATCNAAEAPRLRHTLLQSLGGHLNVNGLTSESRPGGQLRLSISVSSPHAMDDRVESLIAELVKDPTISETSWQVARATPEA